MGSKEDSYRLAVHIASCIFEYYPTAGFVSGVKDHVIGYREAGDASISTETSLTSDTTATPLGGHAGSSYTIVLSEISATDDRVNLISLLPPAIASGSLGTLKHKNIELFVKEGLDPFQKALLTHYFEKAICIDDIRSVFREAHIALMPSSSPSPTANPNSACADFASLTPEELHLHDCPDEKGANQVSDAIFRDLLAGVEIPDHLRHYATTKLDRKKSQPQRKTRGRKPLRGDLALRAALDECRRLMLTGRSDFFTLKWDRNKSTGDRRSLLDAFADAARLMGRPDLTYESMCGLSDPKRQSPRTRLLIPPSPRQVFDLPALCLRCQPELVR